MRHNTKRIIAILLLALVFQLLPAAAFADEAGEHYEKGMELFLAGKYKPASIELRKASGLGSAEAKIALAMCYLGGYGVPQDLERGLDLIAEVNKPGLDTEEARKTILLFAEAGSPMVQYVVAQLYLRDGLFKQDYDEAFRWMKLASDGGSEEAQAALGLMYYEGAGTEKDEEAALALWQKGAEAGSAASQYYLGVHYMSKVDLEDFKSRISDDAMEAVRWLEKAAKQKHISAIYALAVYYYKSGDWEECFEWAKKGADLEDAACESLLAILYTYGLGVNQDAAEAQRWLDKAKAHTDNGSAN